MTLGRIILVGLAAATMLLAAPAAAQAPGAPAPPSTTLDAAGRSTVVEAAAAALRDRYVFPDVGAQAAEAIEAALAAGSYDEITEPWAFAERLTTDLQAVAHDKHLRVSSRTPAPAPTDGGAAPPARPSGEAGITRSDRLADNIGYIEIVAFPPPDMFKPVVDRAMAPLADTRALIIDARRNGGGSPQAVAHLVSYFVDSTEPVHVNDFIWRNPGTDTFRTDEFWTAPTPFSYAGKPVYVLTSGFTFSGGEEFAYDMQVMDLGVTVGEVTGGGANPGGGAPLGADFMMFLPGGRAQNPITGTNWEGVGVTPDVATPTADALKVALEQLGVATTETEIEALSKGRLFEPRSTPHPGTEAAIRRSADELARGEPNYDMMAPGLQEATRQQLASLQEMFTSLGAIESVTFQSVDVMGADVYDVKFANGSVTWMIVLSPDGKTIMSGIRPGSPPAAQPPAQ